MAKIHKRPCPFGGPLWQLWTNQALAYALTNLKSCDSYGYAVIYPEGNHELASQGKVFDQFRDLLSNTTHFLPITLEKVMRAMRGHAASAANGQWVDEFIARYDVSGSAQLQRVAEK